MPRVGLEPTTPVFERPKTVQVLVRAATEIGNLSLNRLKYLSPPPSQYGDRRKLRARHCEAADHKCTLSIRVEIRGTSSRQPGESFVNCRSQQKCRHLPRMARVGGPLVLLSSGQNLLLWRLLELFAVGLTVLGWLRSLQEELRTKAHCFISLPLMPFLELVYALKIVERIWFVFKSVHCDSGKGKM
jgi:hypothetical protein